MSAMSCMRQATADATSQRQTYRDTTADNEHDAQTPHVRRLGAFRSPPERDQDKRLEEVRLFHDAQELLFIDLAVTIAVGLVNHLLKLLICHPLTGLLRNAFQILERNFASLVIVEKAESFQDFVLGIAVQNLVRHHLQELFVTNRPTSIIVDV